MAPAIVFTMAKIFAGLYGTVALCVPFLEPAGKVKKGSFLPPPGNKAKREMEVFCMKVTPIWILAVAVVIAGSFYEIWGQWGYMVFCVASALLYVIPLVKPLPSEQGKPLAETYAAKSNLWIAVFSFIGNYWYTHYFYRVLKADYTFEAHRLNDVPICLYFMTHAYFMFYHTLSNWALRYVRSAFRASRARFAFECALIAALSYSTAFMESLTICGFPYYRFDDRDKAYSLGSAFYAIYFLVSFPAFIRVDEDARRPFSLTKAATESLASGMLVLCLLDFVRLAVGVPLFVPHK